MPIRGCDDPAPDQVGPDLQHVSDGALPQITATYMSRALGSYAAWPYPLGRLHGNLAVIAAQRGAVERIRNGCRAVLALAKPAHVSCFRSDTRVRVPVRAPHFLAVASGPGEGAALSGRCGPGCHGLKQIANLLGHLLGGILPCSRCRQLRLQIASVRVELLRLRALGLQSGGEFIASPALVLDLQLERVPLAARGGKLFGGCGQLPLHRLGVRQLAP